MPANGLRKAPALDAYLKDIQKTAASSFPKTFLDTEEIAQAAGRSVLARVRTEALVWVAGIAFLFTMLQFAVNVASYRPYWVSTEATKDLNELRAKMDAMQTRLLKFEQATPPAPAPTQPNAPSVPPNPPKNG